jgi:HSP20 family protein
VDLTEFEDRYVVTVELPGLSRADVQVEYVDAVLSVRGRRPDHGCCPERYQQLERGQGEFARSIQFEHPIKAAELTADLADGVLTITVPKAAAVRRDITVG